jgi:16S rRNA (guanine527-N7)-methyltransferase
LLDARSLALAHSHLQTGRPLTDPELVEALASSQCLGMLGDRPIPEVIEHATAFVTALEGVTGTVVDLGSGGGVPGLVIARARPDLRLVLVDRRAARTDHLTRLVRRLRLEGRVTVLNADVTALQLPADAAVARGFGAPGATLRAGARVVRPGGLIVVSEPPDASAGRWTDQPETVIRAQSPDPRVAVFHVKHEGA